MAIWQFDFFLASKQPTGVSTGIKQIATFGDNKERLIQFAPSRLTLSESKNLIANLSSIVSWNDDIKTWGIEDGNRIDILLNGPWVKEIFVRLDVRHIDTKFIGSILDFASVKDLIIITQDGKIIPPSYKLLHMEIRKSPSCKYVSNPVEFLRNLPDI